MTKLLSTPVGPSVVLLPKTATGSKIPRILHQTYPTVQLPPRLEANVRRLRDQNPHWEYRFYSDADVESFILHYYGNDVLSAYLSIDERYGAARADLFRYLAIYKHGGVYLDIKSYFTRPIEDVLTLGESIVLSHWSNEVGEKHEGASMDHPELAHMPHGEFQQWHIISVKGHPFLLAVIHQVLANIGNYRPWKDGVGSRGVIRLTGPIAYTRAIAPLIHQYPCKVIRNEAILSLEYSVGKGQEHHIFSKSHYSKGRVSIIKLTGIDAFLSAMYILARRLKRRILDGEALHDA